MDYFYKQYCYLCGSYQQFKLCKACETIKKVIDLYSAERVCNSIKKAFVIKSKDEVVKDDDSYDKKEIKDDIEDTKKPVLRIHTRSIKN